jgi:hypothetical protein
MKNYINTIKNVCAFCAFFSLMIGGCLADNESLLPTILFVGLGAVLVLIHKRIEKAQEEENNKAN